MRFRQESGPGMGLSAVAGDACLSAALLLAGGLLPPLHGATGALPTILLAAAGLALLLADRPLAWRHAALLPVPLLAALLPVPARAAALGLGLALLVWLEPGARRAAFLARLALLVCGLGLALWIPQAYFLFDGLARVQSDLLAQLAGRPLRLGEGPLLHIPLFFLLRAALQWLGGGGARRLWTSGGALILHWLLLSQAWRLGWATPDRLEGWIPLLLFLLFFLLDQLAGEPALCGQSSGASGRGPFIAALLLPAGAALGLALCLTPPPARLDGVAVGIRQAGLWSAELPVEEDGAAPRLGGLLAVLRTWGAHVEVLNDAALTAGPACRVLFVVQPDQPLAPELRAALRRWLEAGGVLIAVGEHTHVHGIGVGMGSLLQDYHIKLRDDSAIPSLNGWQWGHDLRFHASPATAGLRDSQHLGASIGASLDVRFPAMPLVTGCLAFADTGDPSNPRGRLGNTRPDPGERLGSVPLLAAEPVGKGLLVVLGDKSPLMSLNNPLVWPFYLNLSGRLEGRTWQDQRGLRLALLALLLASLWPVLRGLPPRQELAVTALLLPLLAWPLRAPDTPPPAPAARGGIVWIDHSHQPSWWHPPDHDWSPSALVRNTFLAGGLPLALHELDAASLAGSRALLIAGSARAYSRHEQRLLAQYVEQGGRLVIAGDGRRAAGLRGLLAAFGLGLGETPLGSAAEARSPQRGTDFRFWEAWDVQDLRGGADTLVACWGLPIVLERKLGAGRVIVIGDERAFSRWALDDEGRAGIWQSTATRFRRMQVGTPRLIPSPAKRQYQARVEAGAASAALPPTDRPRPVAGPPPAPVAAAELPPHTRWALQVLGLNPARPEAAGSGGVRP
ncbi:MAG: DUF4350 domain-containing protein [Candidatus Delongbacteria bacterium]